MRAFACAFHSIYSPLRRICTCVRCTCVRFLCSKRARAIGGSCAIAPPQKKQCLSFPLGIVFVCWCFPQRVIRPPSSRGGGRWGGSPFASAADRRRRKRVFERGTAEEHPSPQSEPYPFPPIILAPRPSPPLPLRAAFLSFFLCFVKFCFILRLFIFSKTGSSNRGGRPRSRTRSSTEAFTFAKTERAPWMIRRRLTLSSGTKKSSPPRRPRTPS